MNFVKLKNNHNITEADIVEQNELLSIGSGALKNFSIDVNNPVIKEVYGVIPDYAHSYFLLSAVRVSTLLAPHIDDVNTSIMFYVTANNCRTQFYNIINENPDIYYSSTELNGEKLTDETVYKPVTYKLKDLSEDDFYIAKDFEVYCLNGKTPHSVISELNENSIYRSFVLLKTNLTFPTVLSMLEKTNSI